MLYFDHDTAAMGDPKLSELCIEHGPGAVAAYWVALEQIYREETPLVVFDNQGGNRSLTKVVGHWLCTDAETLETWFSTMVDIGLFERDADNPDAVMSPRAAKNIQAYRTSEREKGRAETDSETKPKPKGNRIGFRRETKRQANKRKRKGIGNP